MGKTTFTQEAGLIDIFYKDTTRLDSFIAQLQKGALRQVKLKSNDTQGSSNSQATTVGIPGAAAGNFSRITTETAGRDIEETKDPHDSLVLDLLENLGLPVSEEVSDPSTAKLMLLYGDMELRNFGIINQAIPIFKTLPQFISPELYNGDDSTLSRSEREIMKKKRAEAKDNFDHISSFVKLLPTGLEIYLTLKNGQFLNGMLRPEFMVDPHDMVFRMFGSALPGKWYILAIVDTDHRQPSAQRSNQQLLDGVDSMATMVRLLLSAADSITMTPVLIFRQLCSDPAEIE